MAAAKTSAKKAAKKAPAKKAAGKKATAKIAAPAKKPARGPIPPIVTLKHLGEWLGNSHGMPKKQAIAMLTDFVGDVTAALKKGSKIRIPDFGIMQVRNRPARMGRNPATGEPIKIKASKKVAFRVAKTLKEAV